MKKSFFVLLLVLTISGVSNAATTHTVKNGDTLWDLAGKYYNKPTLYTVIAEVNHISNPRTLRTGTVLIIPNKSDMEAIAAENDSTKRQKLIAQANGGSTNNNDDNNSSNNGNKPAKYVAPKDTSFSSIMNKKFKSDKAVTISNKNL